MAVRSAGVRELWCPQTAANHNISLNIPNKHPMIRKMVDMMSVAKNATKVALNHCNDDITMVKPSEKSQLFFSPKPGEESRTHAQTLCIDSAYLPEGECQSSQARSNCPIPRKCRVKKASRNGCASRLKCRRLSRWHSIPSLRSSKSSCSVKRKSRSEACTASISASCSSGMPA